MLLIHGTGCVKRHTRQCGKQSRAKCVLNTEPLVVGGGEDVAVVGDLAAAVAEAEPRVEAERVHLEVVLRVLDLRSYVCLTQIN